MTDVAPARVSAVTLTVPAGLDGESARLVNSARAEIARLSLELRAVGRKADDAERATPGVALATIDADLAGAREFVRSSVVHHVDARRAEMDKELEEARLHAARIVASAQRRAEAYVAAAHDDVLAALAVPGASIPSLRPMPPVIDPADLVPPHAGDETVARTLGSEAALGVAGMVAALQPLLTSSAAPAAIPAIATLQLPGVMSQPSPPRPPLWRRLLYADVLLPMIAALAVLIVLLAWVG